MFHRELSVLHLGWLSLLFDPTSALAHHSFAATFDSEKSIAVEGVISEFLFIDPHVIIQLEVKNPDGTTTTWISEGDAATRFRHAGWTAETVKTGDRIRVLGSGTHDNSPTIWIEQIELLDSASGALIKELNPHGYPDPEQESSGLGR